MILKWFTVSVLFVGLLSKSTEGLDPYQIFSEGSCSNIRVQPARNLNRAALEDLRYITAGSRYHILRQASPHPRYSTLRDDELYYSFCMQRNTTTLRQGTIGSVNGFGRTLASFDVVPPRNELSGLYLDAIPRDSFPSWDILRQTISLTDNRNFAFVVNCWVGSDQVGWDVITRTPSLDESTRRIVEEHAKQLGFNPENTIVLRHDNCRRNSGQQGEGERSRGQSIPLRPNQNQQSGRNDQQAIQRARLQNLLNLQNQRQQQQPQPQGPSVRGQDNSRRQSLNSRGSESSGNLGPRRELIRPDLLGGVSRGQGLSLRDIGRTDDVEDRLSAQGYRSRNAARGSSESLESSEELRQGRSGRRGNTLRLESSEENLNSRRSGGRARDSSEEEERVGRQRQGSSGRSRDDSSEEQGRSGQRNSNRQRQSGNSNQGNRGQSGRQTDARRSESPKGSRNSAEQEGHGWSRESGEREQKQSGRSQSSQRSSSEESNSVESGRQGGAAWQGRRNEQTAVVGRGDEGVSRDNQRGQQGGQRGRREQDESQRGQQNQQGQSSSEGGRRGPDEEGHGWGKP